MEEAKRGKLEAAGWNVGTAEEFLAIPPAEIVQPGVEPHLDIPPDPQEPNQAPGAGDRKSSGRNRSKSTR